MIKRARWVAFLVASLLFSFLLYGQQSDMLLVQGIRAKDGDTIVVAFSDGTREEVRYASINAPGLDQCFGEEARDYNEALIKGKDLWIELNPIDDGYERAQDRLLAHAFLSPTRTQTSSVSALMVAAGMARLDVFNPSDTAIRNGDDFSVRYADFIIAAQIEAAAARRGWWEGCDNYTESNLIIAAIRQWSDDEIVYLINRGSESVNLAAAWTLRDASGSERNTLDFSDYLIWKCLLPPGGLLRIHSGSIATGRGGEHTTCGESEVDFYWTGHKIWNQDKDEASLYDPAGGLIYDYVYYLDWE
ncbi:MAG: lamin tail domain-containing protein [Candidatus Bipolaricaulota bacterium]|nr:lamin tail domain-containing protein [Candidatus Bipolaricaulota bacterium]